MPLSNLLKSAAGTCPFCHRKAGILSHEHPECRRAHRAHRAGWHEMVQLAAQAAGSPDFDEKTLRLTLAEIARPLPRGRRHRQPSPRGGLEAGRGPRHSRRHHIPRRRGQAQGIREPDGLDDSA